MIRAEKWFTRKFDFDLPVGLFPNLLERLRGTPARLEDRTAGLPSEVLTRREGSSWSIQENVGHLLDLETLHYARLEEFRKGVDVLTAADLQNRKTFDADHNANSLSSILQAFRTGRLSFVSKMEKLAETEVLRTAMHPRLAQPMNLLAFAFFIAEHDDHHLVRITELLHIFEVAS